jgi:hypothetical protein
MECLLETTEPNPENKNVLVLPLSRSGLGASANIRLAELGNKNAMSKNELQIFKCYSITCSFTTEQEAEIKQHELTHAQN